jgi:hypothetical protein
VAWVAAMISLRTLAGLVLSPAGFHLPLAKSHLSVTR